MQTTGDSFAARFAVEVFPGLEMLDMAFEWFFAQFRKSRRQ
jgi:hypothetical protein